MKAGEQPFPSDCQPYQPWAVLVYQCSSFWSPIKNNPIFLVHTHCKEAQKIPSSSPSLSPVTTDLFSYIWKCYTHHMGSLKRPLISLCWCHTHFAAFPKGVSQFLTYWLIMLQPHCKVGPERDSEDPQHVFTYIYIYIYMLMCLDSTVHDLPVPQISQVLYTILN